MDEMKVYFHVRDKVFVTDETGTLGIDKKSAVGRAHEEVIRQGITRFRNYGSFQFTDKSSIRLGSNCFESNDGFEYYFRHVTKIVPNSPEILFLEALRPYVDDEKNLPVSITFSTDRRVDKILKNFPPVCDYWS